jgi:hypothetical protein
VYQESLPELLLLQSICFVNTCQIEANYRFSHFLGAESKLEVLPLDLPLSMQLTSCVEYPAIHANFYPDIQMSVTWPGYVTVSTSNECVCGKCDGMRISGKVCFLFQRTNCTDIPIFLSRYHPKLYRSSCRVQDILIISPSYKFPFGILGLLSLRNTFNSLFLLSVGYSIIL